MRYCFAILLIIGFSGSLFGQESVSYSHFYLNPYVYNPAYAGVEGRPSVSLTHRRQWLGIEDAPVTSNITFHTPVVGGFNLGLNITQDNYGIFKSNGGLLTLGYSVPLGFNQYVSFGISGGAKLQNIDFTNLDLNDPAVAAILQGNTTKLDGNAGIAYHIAGFNLGFSLQNIFKTKTYPSDAFDAGELGLIRNYIISADYMLYFGGDDYIFQPYGLYKSNEGYEPQWEAGGIFHVKHALWVGGSYRKDFGIIGMLGIKLKSSFAIAYAYEMPAFKADGINKSSHEINLSFAFGEKKDRAKKYQTFLASNKPVRPKKKKPKVVEPEPEEPVIVEEEVPEEAQSILDSLDQGGNKIRLIIENQPPENDSTDVVEETEPVLETPVKSLKPAVITKKGNHPFELDEGHYIVLGAYGEMKNAIRANDRLLSQGYTSDFGFSSDKNLFYVYIIGENTAADARKKRDEMRRLPAFKNAWYLLVE